ncbi:MAG: ferrous iron transporter B [Acidobacteria bacterium]|nr:ferrous iron transporter B [Acidobacteriota bacterium]
MASGGAATAPAITRQPAPTPAGPARVVLVGNPNTGKTTLFNRLCGARAKTSNFPGTTTSMRVGRVSFDDGRVVEVVDLPGLYDLTLQVPESRICRSVLAGEGVYRRPDVVVVVVDACNLTRNLVLVAELIDFGVPVVVALNMLDIAQRRGLTLDVAALTRHLGCAVVPMVARRGIGVDEVRAEVRRLVDNGSTPKALADHPRPPAGASHADLADWADGVVEASLGGSSAVGAGTDTMTERFDQTFTHPVLGLVTFGLVMAGMFWTLFAIATVPMDLIEATFAWLGGLAGEYLPPGPIHDLVAEGVIGGVAGTVVFLPQICLLFFLISLLEDTGYLARAAFVMDRLLCRFGLPGHAFVPLLTSHACAVPGIMATRLIPDRRDRLATILVAPMMSCSARLPVYVLLTTLLFREQPLLGGALFAACYLAGAGAAMVTAMVLGRSVLRGRARPMVLELPSYKVPSLTNALLTAKDQGVAFLRTAGTVIMAICIVMWWLSAYPRTDPPEAALGLRAEAAQATGADADALLEEAASLERRSRQAGSFAGRIGRTLEPVFEPLGFDWQLTVGVVTSFLAREVFVSTMSVLVGGSGDPDVDEGVIARIRAATRADGTRLFSPAASASLLVFFVLAMQCLPTLAVTRRETGELRWALLQLGYMSTLAYVSAFVTYQGLRLIGLP